MADQLDMQFLLMALPPAVIEAHLYLDDYQHLDFVWGINAVERVYPQVSVCTHRSVSVCIQSTWARVGSVRVRSVNTRGPWITPSHD